MNETTLNPPSAHRLPPQERRLWTRWFASVWAVLASASVLGSVFAPWLSTHHPLLLVALSPLGRHLLLVAPVVDPVLFVIVVTLRRVASATVFYGLGDLQGENALNWIEARWVTLGESFRLIERLFVRFGPLLVMLGGMAGWLLAGSAHMAKPWYALLVFVGSVAVCLSFIFFGGLFEAPIRVVLDLFRDYVWEATAVFAALALATQFPRLMRWLQLRRGM